MTRWRRRPFFAPPATRRALPFAGFSRADALLRRPSRSVGGPVWIVPNLSAGKDRLAAQERRVVRAAFGAGSPFVALLHVCADLTEKTQITAAARSDAGVFQIHNRRRCGRARPHWGAGRRRCNPSHFEILVAAWRPESQAR